MSRITKIVLIDGIIAGYWLALWLSNPVPARTTATVWEHNGYSLIHPTYPPRDLKGNLLADGPNAQAALDEDFSDLTKKLGIIRDRLRAGPNEMGYNTGCEQAGSGKADR